MIPKKPLPFPVTESDVWNFIIERQNIFHRRFELKEDPPWTTCLDCQLCLKSDRQSIIGFPAHGSGKHRFKVR